MTTPPTVAAVVLAADRGSFDLLVLGVARSAEGPKLAGDCPGLPAGAIEAIEAGLPAVGATGAPDETLTIPGAPYGLPTVVLTGLGEATPTYPADVLRRAAGAALRRAVAGKHADVEKVAVCLPTGDDPQLVAAVALGSLLGAYRYDGLRAREPRASDIFMIGVIVGQDAHSSGALASAVRQAGLLGAAVHTARRLVDTPPGHLPPAKLAQEALAMLDGLPVEVEVFDEQALAEQGFGGIVAVGQGSTNPPRLVRMSYQPESAARHLVLIGKGITFDSGGLSLKPPQAMISMKTDMAGAAAVLAAVATIARLQVATRVTAYLTIAENMPGGRAQRPGDVITAYGGKTVEVLNTDAEGRLVMMDALVRCGADQPDAIIDIATLTGAQIVALGARIAGIMGNDDTWRAEVAAAAEDAGELAWQMPIPEECKPSLESPIADLANIGERNGGMMTAAAFLREFVPEGVPWAHIDIAGPAYVSGEPWGYYGKGATGFGVATLVRVAQRMSGQQPAGSGTARPA